MAASAATLYDYPTTLEIDGTGAVITKGLPNLEGAVVNGGSTKFWVQVSVTDTNAAAPALTDAQADYVVGVPPGATLPILRHYKTFFPKTSSGTSVGYWIPGSVYGYLRS